MNAALCTANMVVVPVTIHHPKNGRRNVPPVGIWFTGTPSGFSMLTLHRSIERNSIASVKLAEAMLFLLQKSD